MVGPSWGDTGCPEDLQRSPPPVSGWSGEFDECSALALSSCPPPDPYRNEYGCGAACSHCCACCRYSGDNGNNGDEHVDHPTGSV